ncbi:glycosyl hydrolase family 18 protein [Peribacillus alkalitolerans]|uniref:glycosyl hydrolase family 18 protein n=1 Tax=Peribacillus alkalitolerans TaxID=1550385 RepID=UPI001F07E98C|nr:LysM peptidoglycan-binding domain-containing protein [Peribacillus alkalitolerans]
MKKLLTIFISGILLLSIVPIKGKAVNQNFTIGTVIDDNANLYISPDLKSSVIAVLKKDEEFPIIASSSGITTPTYHKVTSGNTLAKVAKQYGTTVQDLQKENHLTSSKIISGQALRIPQKYSIHAVQSGESLWKIANKFGVTVSDLKKVNSLKNEHLAIGQPIRIPDYFCQVQILGGTKGWIKKSQLQVSSKDRVVMGWTTPGTNLSYEKNNPVNVVSPRWYTLVNSGKMVTSTEDAVYVENAHKKGKKVWPLIGNLFDPDLTDAILSDSKKRQTLVLTLRDSLVKTKSDGINVDFENINPKNKQDFVQFISELKHALQPYGITLSVDVTRQNEDPFWSGSFDRKELGKIADYIVIMGYDEHWGTSPKAGSVSSLPWIQEGLQLLMQEVPTHKILLGVPFYTREWVTDHSTQTVKSHDRTMHQINQLIASKGLKKVWDQKASQHYVEYSTASEKHQIWIEDKTSMGKRVDLVKQFHLGGTSAWYLGSETQDIWEVFNFTN